MVTWRPAARFTVPAFVDDFARAPDTPVPWDGVRNYQARNFLRQMQAGDGVFIYHSSCRHIGIAGIARVVRPAYPDPTQFDPTSPYHDPKSRPEQPRWDAVDLIFERKLPRLLPLDELRNLPGLASLPLLRKGNRLSVMPVSEDAWRIILAHR